MKKTLFIISLLLFTKDLFAQNQKTSFPFFNNMKGERKVVADTAILKVAPSTGAANADTIFLGNNVNILMQVPFSEVRNNVMSPWLKITYKKGDYTKVAFISSIDVSISEVQNIKSNQVIIGIEKNNRTEKFVNETLKINNNYIGKLILLNGNQKLYQDTFLLPSLMMADSLVNFYVSKTILKKADGLLHINFINTNAKEVNYEYIYVVCNNTLIGLNFINPNPIYQNLTNNTTNNVVFKPKKIIHQLSGALIGTKELATYKWKDCNYIKE